MRISKNNSGRKLPGKKMCFFIAFLALTVWIKAQDEVKLHIGDNAPSIKYSKWLKGAPVESFKGDQLYILEFWATWCGPCKAAMPHLTKLQKEYEGKASFIGVGVWEKVKEGQPYESSLPMVAKYVEGNTNNMGYSVIADNNDQHMGNNWLKAAGQAGIPATFIIKDEKIIWMGHPLALDTMLPKIINGSYNMQEFKIAYEKKAEASRKQMAGITAAMEPINSALKEKDYKKAFELMEKAKTEQPILAVAVIDNLKFKTLLQHFSEKEAIAFAEEWQKKSKSASGYILMAVNEQDGLSKSTYLWALKNFESTNTSPLNPIMHNLIASVYAKAGDYQNAVTNQEKAIEGAKTALKEGKLIGSIMDYTVTEYEETLAEYKKVGKTAKN